MPAILNANDRKAQLIQVLKSISRVNEAELAKLIALLQPAPFVIPAQKSAKDLLKFICLVVIQCPEILDPKNDAAFQPLKAFCDRLINDIIAEPKQNETLTTNPRYHH